jgi:Leucine-rich repeat (LRR) protein
MNNKYDYNNVYLIFRDLSKNNLTVIEGLLFKGLVSLKTLILRQNNIEDLLDGSFYGLTKLQSLYVYNIIRNICN